MTTKTIETMKAEHEAAHDARTGSNGLSALSHAREEMYFRNKDAELIKALNVKAKPKKSKGRKE
jgi:hypothetical protein